MYKILIIEDNQETRDFVTEILSIEQYLVDTVGNGSEGAVRLRDYDYDLIIVDWNLPGQTGPEICKAYRNQNGTSPILMLTGNDSEDDKAFGLDCGADDYLTKPFSLKELLARVRALLRRTNRTSQQSSKSLKVRQLVLDVDNFVLTKNGVEIKLLPKEFALIEFFMRNPNKVFSSQQLLHRVWQTDSESGSSALRTTLSRLRAKLEAEDDSFIETVHGVGFRLRS